MYILNNLVVNTSQVKENIIKVVKIKAKHNDLVTVMLDPKTYESLVKNKSLDLFVENEAIKRLKNNTEIVPMEDVIDHNLPQFNEDDGWE